jgi:hypothetical protein
VNNLVTCPWTCCNYFTFMWPCIVTNFIIIKPTRCTNFTNLFWHETLHVSGSSSVHHQEFIHRTLGNGICHTGLKMAFEQDQDGTAVPSRSCSKLNKLLVLLGRPRMTLEWTAPNRTDVTQAISNPITGLDRPRKFQDVEALIFQTNWHIKVERLLALHTSRFYPQLNIPGTNFC